MLNRNSLILLALVALVASVMLQPQMMSRSVYDFQVTFDISQSMQVEDLMIGDEAASRLSVARQAALELLQQLPCGSRIGWSIFTGKRIVSLVAPVEVCQHYAALLGSLKFIDKGMRWANASAVGKGLHQSIRAAHGMADSTRVVFLTDGQEAPPLEMGHRGMPSTDRYPVAGLIVGVGGVNPVRIPKTYDNNGHVSAYFQADEVVQRPNAAFGQSHEELSSRQDVHLGNLGRLASLTYLPLDTAPQLREAAIIESMAHQKLVPVDLRWIPASLALLFLSLRFFPGRFWR